MAATWNVSKIDQPLQTTDIIVRMTDIIFKFENSSITNPIYIVPF